MNMKRIITALALLAFSSLAYAAQATSEDIGGVVFLLIIMLILLAVLMMHIRQMVKNSEKIIKLIEQNNGYLDTIRWQTAQTMMNTQVLQSGRSNYDDD